MGNKNNTKQVEPPPPVADEGITTDDALVEEQFAECEHIQGYLLNQKEVFGSKNVVFP